MLIYLLFISLNVVLEVQSGILYPRSSEARQVVSLDGFWSFVLSDGSKGYDEKWYQVDFKTTENLNVSVMAVPSSFNDIGADAELRDHVGPVWYQRKFYPPRSWVENIVWVRFGSVCRGADVWINGQLVVSHDIGHLPFQADISSVIKLGDENVITVAVDNRLYDYTIPQGTVGELPSGRIKQDYTFDFFNYAGIDRSVVLYTTPKTYIDDITILTDVDGPNGFVNYSIKVEGSSQQTTAKISIIDKLGKIVATDTVLSESIFIQNANFWWPYLMDSNPGYLYSFQVELEDMEGNLLDKYVLPIGIRSITWNSKSVNINNKKIYLRGFGRHEDSDMRGKGLDLPLILRDHNLIKWLGANSYRTSHYPYAEEIMDIADEYGIMIIDESPAVNTEQFSDKLLANHKKAMTELIQRDKNRPSVIMWSAANEPYTQYPESENYYKEVIGHIKTLDQTRPVTIDNYQEPDIEYSGQFIDVAGCNIYYGWYFNPADMDLIISQVVNLTRRWNELHNIPVIIMEYGADTQEGFHSQPSVMWSEEFQMDLLGKYFMAFDQLRSEGFFIGEMIWNFADFATAQSFIRVGGNKKGIFTRNRQPKASAYYLRERYWALASSIDNSTVPDSPGCIPSGGNAFPLLFIRILIMFFYSLFLVI